MTILWSIASAAATALITTLVLHFFPQRMTENAKKPRMTRHHQGLIDLLSHPNAIAMVQLPNNGNQNYEVVIGGHYRIAGGAEDNQLEAFDEMVEHKIVLPINEHSYRLSHNFRSKYRKPV